MNDFIPLDRQFLRWQEEEQIDLELAGYLEGSSSTLDWTALLERRRVVILAEAGSGKSTELRERFKVMNSTGKTAFLTTLQKIGQRGGVESALGASEWRRFLDWQSSGGPCWLFLDSVDEAKRADFELVDILTDVADAIDGFSARVHIILTGRVSDWQFKRDMATLLERIPIPPTDTTIETIDLDKALVDAMRKQRRESNVEPPETPLVVVLAALDRGRVERFARAQGILDVDRMFKELERRNLWTFARRPTDLDWLAGYWRAHGRFGSLQDMLDVSITERLKETNASRSRSDTLDASRARRAIERVGAALVLQKLDTVVVPDTSSEARRDIEFLDLKAILPDLSPGDQVALGNRAIFDPATPGFVRLHADNQGQVRGFLTARWLTRLRHEGNLPVSRFFELLLADTYGVSLVIPSMRSTAAWMALWHPEVAQEVIKRDPRLLMDAGDPSSLGLETRVRALDGVLQDAVEDEHFAIPDHDALQRFALPDLEGYVRERWASLKGSPGARTLLLLLIHLGKFTSCADIAEEAVRGGYRDRYTPIFGGRALLSSGSSEQLRAYVRYLVEHPAGVHPSMVWDALDELYPRLVAAGDLISLLASAHLRQDDTVLDLSYYGPRLAARIPDRLSAETVVDGLLGALAVKFDPYQVSTDRSDDKLLEALEVAAARYAALVGDAELPNPIVDVAVRLGESRRARRRLDTGDDALDLAMQINATAGRRRLALWRCFERFIESGEAAPVHPWQLQITGMGLSIRADDLDWLIDDIQRRPDEDGIKLATNGAMRIWRDEGSNLEVLERIRAAASAPAAKETVDEWLAAPRPDATELERQAKRADRIRRDAAEQLEVDRSWLKFRDGLREDPGKLLRFVEPADGKVDATLYHMWLALSRIAGSNTRRAIADVSPLRPLFGDQVIANFQTAMIRYWRLLSSTLPSERPPEKRGVTYTYDMMGIACVTFEAASDPLWATKLGEAEAELAIRFATWELNGFPKWLDDLAKAHPTVVRDVLWGYLASDLEGDVDPGVRTSLRDVAGAGGKVVELLAPKMLEWIEEHPETSGDALEKAVHLVAADRTSRVASVPLATARALSEKNRHKRGAYFRLLYSHDGAVATDILMQALEAMPKRDQIRLVQAVLPRSFSSDLRLDTRPATTVSTASLEQLVLLAFEHVHPLEDNDRPNFETYTPDDRDHAENARGALFNALVNTPGHATYAAIQRFLRIPDFPVWERRLKEAAFGRAAADSERPALRSVDVLTFEKSQELVPATSEDLQRVGLARLADIAHQLEHGDFNQGMTVARLPNEVDVQNWFADRLASLQGQSYSLEREPHVAEEKEPDIRLGSLRDPGAKSPIEIKVASSWSITELEEALTVQLQGRYLRDKDNRYGILLVVHNTVRARGWELDGSYAGFAEVMSQLEGIANEISTRDALAPQMVPFGIDLSSFAQKLLDEAEAPERRSRSKKGK